LEGGGGGGGAAGRGNTWNEILYRWVSPLLALL
jgi:hypothetical protein